MMMCAASIVEIILWNLIELRWNMQQKNMEMKPLSAFLCRAHSLKVSRGIISVTWRYVNIVPDVTINPYWLDLTFNNWYTEESGH